LLVFIFCISNFYYYWIEGDKDLGGGTKVNAWAWGYTDFPQNDDLKLKK